jgi:uncharacterized membrane-anchored protein
MINRRWLLVAALAVAVVQIGFLVSMIAGRAAILRSGQEVLLEVRPIDPRDLLRGDYVILGYNISSIPADLFAEKPAEDEEGEDRVIFVRLKAGEDGLWEPIAARYGEKPQPDATEGEIDIKGSASATWFEGTTSVDVLYGIERFYVPEGEGKAIENDLRERPFRMRVAVAEDGSAQIKAFMDGDTMLYAEPLY